VRVEAQEHRSGACGGVKDNDERSDSQKTKRFASEYLSANQLWGMWAILYNFFGGGNTMSEAAGLNGHSETVKKRRRAMIADVRNQCEGFY
jgi:hypothetical protein